MLEQTKSTKYITGYKPEVVASEVNILRSSITQTDFPFIEIAKFSGGSRAVIRGTRVPVSVIIGYLSMGETPKSLIEKVLPHLNLMQIYNSIEFYATYKEQIDKERQENTEAEGKKQLRMKLGNEGYQKITGK